MLNGSCECVCMSECVLIYFLSFAQLEKKNEQAEKKDCYHGSAEAFFFFYWMIIIVIILLSVQNFFSLCFSL